MKYGYVAVGKLQSERTLTRIVVGDRDDVSGATAYIRRSFAELSLSKDPSLAYEIWALNSYRVRRMKFRDDFAVREYMANNEKPPPPEQITTVEGLKREMKAIIARSEFVILSPKVAKITNVVDVFNCVKSLFEALLSMPPFNI